MIVFAIPLRSKGSTSNWESVVARFNATVQSIFNQTNPNFKVIVACNDIPAMRNEYDDRLEFIKLDMPAPSRKRHICNACGCRRLSELQYCAMVH